MDPLIMMKLGQIRQEEFLGQAAKYRRYEEMWSPSVWDRIRGYLAGLRPATKARQPQVIARVVNASVSIDNRLARPCEPDCA